MNRLPSRPLRLPVMLALATLILGLASSALAVSFRTAANAIRSSPGNTSVALTNAAAINSTFCYLSRVEFIGNTAGNKACTVLPLVTGWALDARILTNGDVVACTARCYNF